MGNVSGGSLNPAVPWNRNGGIDVGICLLYRPLVWQSSIKHLGWKCVLTLSTCYL